MANTKISALTSGSPAQATDAFAIARSGANYKLVVSDVISAAGVAVASGKTLTVSNSLTVAGTDGTTMTFPSTSATIARTDAGNTFTGHQTIEGVTSTGATGTGNLVFSVSPTLTGTVGMAAATLSNTITSYNGLPTVGMGTSVVVAAADLTAQTAAKTATTLYTPSASGMFCISAYLKITTVGTSPVLGPVTITFQDATDSVAQSVVMSMQTQTGAQQATGNSGNTTTSLLSGSLIIWAHQSTAITYAIALTGTVGTAQYEAHLKCEAM